MAAPVLNSWVGLGPGSYFILYGENPCFSPHLHVAGAQSQLHFLYLCFIVLDVRYLPLIVHLACYCRCEMAYILV